MKIELLESKLKKYDFKLALNEDVFRIGNWITDGCILIDTDTIDVVANVRNEKIPDAERIIEKMTSKEILEEVLKEKHEVEIGKFAYDTCRLMYHVDESIKELINEFYVNQFMYCGFAFSYYDDSFYIFDIIDDLDEVESFEVEEDTLYLQLVGILKKCEAKDETIIPQLWNLEQQIRGQNNDR